MLTKLNMIERHLYHVFSTIHYPSQVGLSKEDQIIKNVQDHISRWTQDDEQGQKLCLELLGVAPKPQAYHLLVQAVKPSKSHCRTSGAYTTKKTEGDKEHRLNIGRLLNRGPLSFAPMHDTRYTAVGDYFLYKMTDRLPSELTNKKGKRIFYMTLNDDSILQTLTPEEAEYMINYAQIFQAGF